MISDDVTFDGPARTVGEGELERDGFSLATGLIDPAEGGRLQSLFTNESANARKSSPNSRGLLDSFSDIRELAAGLRIKSILKQLTSHSWFAVRGLLFDKTAEANWQVRWHQDQTVAVREQKETPGFAGWSKKEGVIHGQASVEVLAKMIAVRIHLDAADAENGALQVISGSHRSGRVSPADRDRFKAENPQVVCVAGPGDALLMRPLLLHRSSKAIRPKHRRVLHLEYSCAELPGDLEWYWWL